MRVHAAAPKGEAVAKFPLQPPAVHVLRADLDGVQDIHALAVQVVGERQHAAAGVVKEVNLRGAVLAGVPGPQVPPAIRP